MNITIRRQYLEHVLDVAVREYDDLSQTFANLDGKAQNTIAAAGIFLAAITAFLDQARLQEYLRIGRAFSLAFLGGAAALLVASIIACLISTRIRKVPMPLSSEELAKMVNDMLGLDSSEVNETRLENFMRDQIGLWQETITGMMGVNESKARAVSVGQALLLMAAVFLGFLLVARVMTSGIAS